jgi:signal transduction histidine kinase
VSDTGPGIPESEREHVLERFVRLESSRHTPGNGLGLSLVKAVSKLHKAELLLGDASPGLVVTIRFPRTRPE